MSMLKNVALVSNVNEGDILIVDGGFDCMPEHSAKKVMRDKVGLYVECDSGKHYLAGQASFCEVYVGFRHA